MRQHDDRPLDTLGLDELLALAVDGEPLVHAGATPAAADARIAVIGMAARIGDCDDLDAFWALLRDGRTATRELPAERAGDLREYLRLKGALAARPPVQVLRASFLGDIDRFDHRFFGLARQEANLTDPSQRLFLQTAWAALEHAGHGGVSVKGSSTGVFVGFSSDFGEDYRRLAHTLAPDAPEIAVAGNVKSIIASRIAYHLDLRGPSLLVDTACSSGLVAVHLACRALRQGDCAMAIAGAVKVDLIPVVGPPGSGIGIRDIQDTVAGDGRTRSFDDGCDGTSAAEGVIAFVLKPLARALADGDTVHAVIRGSATNQDGRSVGITAPNAAAQEQLIVDALRDAGVGAAQVSYVEAHGTATRLGDPIEVNGIQRAFRHGTARRQFCAIGSVKSNIGHLDNAAGLAGMAKVILAMQHRQLPPTLHFSRPNRSIPFEASPVYVNDLLRPWGDAAEPVFAGVNAFGLSGTNCHVVLESAAPAAPEPAEAGGAPAFLYLLSATSEAALRESARRHLAAAPVQPLRDAAFTAATGRMHHGHRLALLCATGDDLRRLLQAFTDGELPPGEAATGSHRDVGERAPRGADELDATARAALDRRAGALTERIAGAGADRRALLREAMALYVRGASIDWPRWFDGQRARRVPLPTYPFAPTRCWVETTPAAVRLARRGADRGIDHPLLDGCIAHTAGLRIYQSLLGADTHWELADHRVQGDCVLPGTAFVEIMLAVAAELGMGPTPCIEQLVFLRPLALGDTPRRVVHTIVSEADGQHQLRIVSRADGDGQAAWTLHAEARLTGRDAAAAAAPAALDLAALRRALPLPVGFDRGDDERRGLRIGERWHGAFRQGWQDGSGDELLVELALPAPFADEAARYRFHPALLDSAVNAASHRVGDGALLLPLSYRRFEVHGRLPACCVALLRRRPGHSPEAASFDIDLADDSGRICARIVDYTIKRVDGALAGAAPGVPALHALRLQAHPVDALLPAAIDGPVLVVGGDPALARTLREGGIAVETVARVDDAGALAGFDGRRFGGVVYAGCEMAEFLAFVQAFTAARLRCSGNVVVWTRRGVAGADGDIDPRAAALLALARNAALEMPGWRLSCVDSDAPLDAGQWRHALGTPPARDLWALDGGRQRQACLFTLPPPAAARFEPRRDGVYLITGGTGALGLEVATLIAQRGPAALALLASSPLPARDAWPQRAARDDGGRFRQLLAIEATGARVECIAADVADPAAMQAVLDRLRRTHGALRGVVHAAGRAGDGFLLHKSAERFAQVLRPKVDGAWLLHALTRGDALDFFVLFSSIASVLRNPGQCDYGAANAHLDALAQHRRAQGLPAVSICWPAWREVGIAVRHGAVDEAEFFAPIATADALALLEPVLAGAPLPPVVIAAAINRRATVEQAAAAGLELAAPLRAALRRTGEPAAPMTLTAAPVSLRGIDDPDPIDLAVAGLWAQTLGVHEIDADDGFNELGGNSILSTQLYRAYEARYPGAMDVADLFTRTTVREQAAHLRRAIAPATAAAAPATDVDDVLSRLARGELSAEQAQALLPA